MKKYRNFCEVLEAANQQKNSAMEAENHVKHGAGSKSHTSRGFILRYACFTLLAAVIVFGGCDDDNGNEPETYTLTVNVEPQDGGSVTIQPEKDRYQEFEVVFLTATVNDGYTFEGWEIGGQIISDLLSDFPVIMDANHYREVQ